MTLYRMLIKPQICYPDQHYNAVCRDLEENGKWYPSEEKEAIKKKYKHLENTFEQIVFDVKYEPIDAISVEWLENKLHTLCFEAMGAGALYSDRIVELAKSINEVIKLWQKEQEENSGRVSRGH